MKKFYFSSARVTILQMIRLLNLAERVLQNIPRDNGTKHWHQATQYLRSYGSAREKLPYFSSHEKRRALNTLQRSHPQLSLTNLCQRYNDLQTKVNELGKKWDPRLWRSGRRRHPNRRRDRQQNRVRMIAEISQYRQRFAS